VLGLRGTLSKRIAESKARPRSPPILNVVFWSNNILRLEDKTPYIFEITTILALKKRINYSMHDLFNNLDQSTLAVLKLLGTATVLWAAWRIFVKDVGLKTFTVKFAWFVIDLLEPERPQRKPNVRSVKKPFNKRRS
jgi:hypothetical protein